MELFKSKHDRGPTRPWAHNSHKTCRTSPSKEVQWFRMLNYNFQGRWDGILLLGLKSVQLISGIASPVSACIFKSNRPTRNNETIRNGYTLITPVSPKRVVSSQSSFFLLRTTTLGTLPYLPSSRSNFLSEPSLFVLHKHCTFFRPQWRWSYILLNSCEFRSVQIIWSQVLLTASKRG